MTEPAPPFNVRAIAAYEARNNAEVSLEIGKIYNVLNTDGKGLWWQTKDAYDGHIGWFPASYTEVVYDSAPQVPTMDYSQPSYEQYAQPAVVVSSQPQQSQPQVPSRLTTSSSTNTVATVTAQSSASDSPAPGEKPPEPVNKPQRQKETTPVYVTLQLCKARGLRGDASKTNPVGFIYKRNIMDSSLGEELFKTDVKSKLAPKKTVAPEWNERFTINVRDAETEIICVRFANGPKFTQKGTKYLGEIEFPLRGAVRDFDKPNYKYKWYPVKGKGKDSASASCTGEALIYIEFVDTRESAPPTNFEHKSHVGLTKDGAFDINNIPAEWKKIFKSVGLRKQDLQNNSELAKAVIEVMEQGDANNATQTSTSAPPPPPPPVIAGPSPPPPPPIGQKAAPAPPPIVPTRPAVTEQSEPAGYTPAAEPEPEQVSIPAGSAIGGGGSFLDAIAARTTKLKPVEPVQQKPAPSSNSLADTLKAAMIAHRKDIEGDDNEEDDDWSE